MKKIIELKQIRRTYQIGAEPIHALRDVSLDIHEGEYVAIMGHSGSGKSTLLNILGCLDTPDHGNYLLNEQETATLSEDEITMVRNKEIGFVFQNFNLLSRYSALENVCLPLIYSGIKRDKRIALAQEALLRVGLEKRMHHKPSELSGGQHQRVAIARALVNQPSIILADEPTGNLDSKTTIEIMELFTRLNEAGNTIIIVTHEDDVAAYTRRIITLVDGTIHTDQKISKSFAS